MKSNISQDPRNITNYYCRSSSWNNQLAAGDTSYATRRSKNKNSACKVLVRSSDTYYSLHSWCTVFDSNKQLLYCTVLKSIIKSTTETIIIYISYPLQNNKMNCCSEDTSSSGCCCGCGQTKRETRICMCLPYKDGFMITAQIISIIAFGLLCGFISGWLTLIVGLISSVFLQLVWCCRQSKIGLFVSVGISTLAGITCTIAGIVTFSAWKDQFSVFTVFDADGSDDFYDDYDQFYGVAAFITATLWFTTSGLILYFFGRGRKVKRS